MFESIKPIIKYKHIILMFIVIILLLVAFKRGVMRNMVEGFESTTGLFDSLLNAKSETDTLINDVFTSITADSVTINKSIISDKNISIDGDLNCANLKVSGKITIGGTTLEETELKKIKGSRNVGGWSVDEENDATSILINGFVELQSYEDNRWDYVWLLPGWQITLWENANKTQVIDTFVNTSTYKPMKYELSKRNNASAYELNFVGY